MNKSEELFKLKKTLDELLSTSNSQDDDEFFIHTRQITEKATLFLNQNKSSIYDSDLKIRVERTIGDATQVTNDINELERQSNDLIEKENTLNTLIDKKADLELRIQTVKEEIPKLIKENQDFTESLHLLNERKDEIEKVHGANQATYFKHFEANNQISNNLENNLQSIAADVEKLLTEYDNKLKSILSIKEKLPIEKIAEKYL